MRRRGVIANLSRVFKVGMIGEVRKQSMLCGYLGKVEFRLREWQGQRL